MAFTFPSSPATNDTYTVGSRTYTWTGSVWEMTGGLITTNQLTDLGVTTAKIDDLAVTAAKIAGTTITEGKIASNAITTGKIASNAVTQAKLDSTLSGVTVCTSSTKPASPLQVK